MKHPLSWLTAGLLLLPAAGALAKDKPAAATAPSSAAPAAASKAADSASADAEAADGKKAGKGVQLHPLPQVVANNSTITLHCGRHYYGTLNLNERSNVTVRTEGACGKASISPGQPVKDWSRQRGSIWIAPLRQQPAIVTFDGKPLALAHYPNKPWGRGKSTGPDRIQAALPSEDLTGATVVYRPEEWMIETRAIAGYDNGAILLGPKVGDAFDPKPETQFYVEGKLWMLDSPGEWAWQEGWLYLWTPDGQAPEGRVWAAPRANGINADTSRNITIDNVRVHTASTGISAGNSSNLHLRNVEVANVAVDGIFVGGHGVLIEGARVSNAMQNGIIGFYGISDVAVINSNVSNTGMAGMPKRSRGGITFEQSSQVRIMNNRVANSSYIGIRVHRDAVVSNNSIDGACLVLSDCGGIYTFAPDKLPLNVRIENNTVRNLAGRYAYGIYLDDSGNGVTVRRNLLANNPGGLEIHNGYNNLITENVFMDSGYEHILFNETGRERVSKNRILKNVFISSKKEATFRLWSEQGGKTIAQFGDFEDNLYVGSGSNFAELQNTGMVSWQNWRTKMIQDTRSRLETRLEAGREQARRWVAGAVTGKGAQ